MPVFVLVYKRLFPGRLKNKGHFFMILFHSGFLGCRWTPKWLRQYVHEDDITDIVALLAFSPLKQRYEVFLTSPLPAGSFLEMIWRRPLVRERFPYIHGWFAWPSLMWHLTRVVFQHQKAAGKGIHTRLPWTAPRLQKYGFNYKWQSKDAFVKKKGGMRNMYNTIPIYE